MTQTLLSPQELPAVDGDQLVDELTARDVHFLRGGTLEPVAMLSTAQLLAALASSEEARLRLAIIPLLLRHSEYTNDIKMALLALPPAAQITLKCYYTAALFLQQKYAKELQILTDIDGSLPDQFSAELGVSCWGGPDENLQQLAQCQAMLTDFYLNWHGTYEHAAQTFITILKRRQAWQI